MRSRCADGVGVDLVRTAEAAYGVPRVVGIQQEILPWELDLIERICGDTRFHDVTVFTFCGAAMALIHKPSDPPGALWAATGGVEPGESIAEAGAREAWEETGLLVNPCRYVLRMRVLFTCGSRRRPWTSHVFTMEPASPAGEGCGHAQAAFPPGIGTDYSGVVPVYPSLSPVDRHEVEYAEWVTVSRFREEIAPVLRSSGWGRFQYRLALTGYLFAELGV